MNASTEKTQHTPGPWTFKTDHFTGDNGIRAEGTGVFAEAFADIRFAGEGARDEAVANARLITAATDMLAALKGIRAHRPDHADSAWDAVDEAIAKAVSA